MYQGSIGKLINIQTKEEKWCQKLRCDGGACFVNLDNPEEHISLGQVAENDNFSEKMTYYVAFSIDGEDVARYSHFNVNDVDFRAINAIKQAKSIKESIEELKSQKKSYKYYLDKYGEYKIKDEIVDGKIKELESILETVDSGNPILYRYVYGKHTADTKEYCWILPWFIDVVIGDTILVETSMGNAKAIVTKIEESYELRDRKRVLKKCS